MNKPQLKKKPKPKNILDNLAEYPRLNDIFVWSDYVEIRCFVHPDGLFSRSSLSETTEEMEEVVGDIDLEVPDEELEDDEEEAHGDEGFDDSPPEKQDRRSRKAAEVFSHIRVRSHLFGEELYPFIIDDESKSISLKEELTEWHHAYIQLLISSALRYVPHTRRQEVTDKFEVVSHEIFKQLMPAGWEVHQFGKNSSTRYTGHLFDKLTALAADVRGMITCLRKDFDENDRGDGGLDLVAWHPMGDSRRSMPIAFAQCGCTADSYGPKTLDASPAMLGNKIAVAHRWATYYFMPQSLHDGSDWIGFKKFGSAIVLDRYRILILAHQYAVKASSLYVPALISEARALSYS